MDKRELSQISNLTKEIAILRKQIDNTEYLIKPDVATDSVKGSSKCFPYAQHTILITGIDYREYDRKVKILRNQLKRRIEELMDKVIEANEYIKSVQDSEMRTILTLRYINGLSWYQVAAHMGTAGDGSTERKKHDRFMKFSRNS